MNLTNLEDLKGSIVTIHSEDFNGNEIQGSGVILYDKGVLVTNFHLITGNKSIEIRKGGKKINDFGIKGFDAEDDILIIGLDTKPFYSIPIGDDSNLAKGDKIFTISSPMGKENLYSEGEILGLQRNIINNTITSSFTSNRLLQFTADISKGSSGGAIFNSKGELIGIISSQTVKNIIINYAIPISKVDELIEKHTKSDPSFIEASCAQLFGRNAFDNRDFNTAIMYYSKYLELLPDDYHCLVKRADALNETRDFESAMKDCDTAISLKPENADAYGVRAQIYQYKREFDLCEKFYLQALQLERYNFVYTFNLSFCYFQQSNYPQAIKYLSQVLELDPIPMAIHLLGDCYFESKDPETAIKYYDQLLNIEDEDAHNLYSLSYAYFELSEYQKSIKLCNKALRLEPFTAHLYQLKAFNYAKLKNDEKVLINLNNAIKASPDTSDYYIHRGEYYFSVNNYKNTIEDFEYAIHLNPNLEEAYREKINITKRLLYNF